jgi:hypothetical protein
MDLSGTAPPLRRRVSLRRQTRICDTEAVIIYGEFALLARLVIALQVLPLRAPWIRLFCSSWRVRATDERTAQNRHGRQA